jgi:hypothetical protein
MGDIGGRHRIFSPPPPEGTAPTVPFHGRCFAQRTKAKAPAFPTPESNQRKNPNPPRVLLEGGPWRGAEDSNLFAREYCYISWPQCLCRVAHSVLEHRLSARSVATFITKRACLLRSQRSVRSFGGRRLWRGPSAAEGASSWDGYWGRVACDAQYGLPRTPFSRTSESAIHAKYAEGGKDTSAGAPHSRIGG